MEIKQVLTGSFTNVSQNAWGWYHSC